MAGQLTSYGFLSTLSLRRATVRARAAEGPSAHFYPRSPCGERRTKTALTSTVLNFYPRSPCGERRCPQASHARRCIISIHALLAESDSGQAAISSSVFYFYPRSPCGERLTWDSANCDVTVISIHALLAESDADAVAIATKRTKFLSTLSLRRATFCYAFFCGFVVHFYPRSPCGERRYL